jgi:hypothetical protein
MVPYAVEVTGSGGFVSAPLPGSLFDPGTLKSDQGQ